MAKDIVKNEDNIIKKTFSPQEMRTNVLPHFTTGNEPDDILKKLNAKLAEAVDKKGVISPDAETQKLFTAATMILGLDNHHALIMAVKEDYRSLAIEFANNLNKEYVCNTPSEKALSQVAVNAYLRLLDDARRYNNCSDAGEYISEVRTKHLAMLSKQMDRANRQFISALSSLKQLKNPPMEFTVKAKTAFISQNQQINTDVKSTQPPYETNEPK